MVMWKSWLEIWQAIRVHHFIHLPIFVVFPNIWHLVRVIGNLLTLKFFMAALRNFSYFVLTWMMWMRDSSSIG